MTCIELGIVACPIIGIICGFAFEAKHGVIAALIGGLAGGVIGFAMFWMLLGALALTCWVAGKFEDLQSRRRAATDNVSSAEVWPPQPVSRSDEVS